MSVRYRKQIIASSGTKVNLNGVDTDDAKFYAPVSAGTSGYTLVADENGVPVWTSGASKVNLNGEDVTDAKFYAPVSAGTSGQTLIASGDGKAPEWKNYIEIVSLTQAEYNTLTSEQKTDLTKLYQITDDTPAETMLTPTGALQMFLGTTCPSGWLYCLGQAVSRTVYANLFAVIGTKYGAGDGSTTFNLPDFSGRFPEGATSTNIGTLKSAGLPNVTGYMGGFVRYNGLSNSGALVGSVYGGDVGTVNAGTSYKFNNINFDASKSNSIYGNATTVQPASICVYYIIKY